MKFTSITFSAIGLLFSATNAAAKSAAFVPFSSLKTLSPSSKIANNSNNSLHNNILSYSLQPEPEGGEEISSIDTMPGSRMKNMGTVGEEQQEGEEQAYTFWLEAEADGKLIKEYRIQVEKDASKKANFPGFRKGQIPPYAQPKMTMFAIQEGVIKTCESAVAAYGLKALPGDAGSVEVHEDIQEICKGYKIGDPVKFTATFKATFDPEKIAKQNVEEEEEEEEEEEKVAETVEE
jgi:hypothetical protein